MRDMENEATKKKQQKEKTKQRKKTNICVSDTPADIETGT